MKPLRILHALPVFAPSTYHSGPLSITRNICRGLADRGHDVSVFTTDVGIGTGVARDQWVPTGPRLRVWYAKTNALTGTEPFWAPRLHRPLARALADADVLHLSVALTLINALGRRLARRFGVPYVLSTRGVLEPQRLRIRRWSKALFISLIERRVIRDAAAIHVLTAREADDLRRLGARDEQLLVLPNAVDMGDPATWPQPAACRARFDLPADAAVVLYLGRVMKLKGIDLLIQTIARVRDAFPHLVLAVVGPEHRDEGERARALARELGLSQAVRFIEPVIGDDRVAAYRAADIFALTSYSEGLPNAVLEAAAMGLPLLITDRCNVPEVADYGAGRVEPPEPDRLAGALHAMLADEPLRRTMSKDARRMATEKFALEPMIERLESSYRSLCHEPP